MKLKQISRRTVSVVLAVLMVLSTLLVGSISTVNAVGASDGKLASGETLYYDFTKITIGGINYRGETTEKFPYLSHDALAGQNYIVSVVLQYDLSASSTNANCILKTEKGGWDDVKVPSNPADGQNMLIVSEDGKSCTWGTYGGGSGETTTGWAITGNINGTDNWTTDYNKTSIKFTETSTNIYKADVSVTDSSKWFRIISSNNKQYGSSDTQNNYSLTTNGNKSSATALTTSENSAKALTIDENGDWSIYLDTSGSTPKVWYTAQTTVSKNWAIVGDTVTGGQNWPTTDYYNNANIKFTQDAANENLYTADVTTIDGHNYFRLIDSDNIQYGATGATDNVSLEGKTSSDNAYQSTKNTDTGKKALTLPVGSWTVHIDTSTVSGDNGPKIWYTAATAPTTSTIYFKPNGNWALSGENCYAVTLSDNTARELWLSLTDNDGDGVYTVENPDTSLYTHVTFDKMTSSELIDTNRTNYSAYQTIPTDGKNLFTLTSDDAKNATGTWSTYDPTPATKEYYLVGTINGDHYLESYAENNPPSATEGYTELSTYKFDEKGELTLEITQDSYVFVSTKDKTLYTTNDWHGTDHPQTLYKNSSKPNKIQVNTGKYIFKITKITDDTLKLDYTPVTAATHNVTATAVANGSVDKTSQSVAEGSKYWVTATAYANYVIDKFTVDDSEVSAASGQSSYTYEGTMGQSDVNINVTFKAATVTDEYYFKGDQDGWQVHKMLSSTDGTYYYYPLTTQNVQFLISESADFSSYYNKENVVQNYDGTNISEVGNYGDTNAYVWYANNGAQYYVRFYPGVNKICASTTVDGATDTFSVTMTQGVSSVIDGEGLRGNSGFGADDVSNVTYAKSFTKDNLSVQFYTKMQTKFDTDYKYAVQGYSIVMTTTDGKQVASVLKENISQPKPGEYSGSYTFPENIVSATVTPVFTVSKEYAASKNITFTTVYLKYKPNSSPLNTYEPTYYTWRNNGSAQLVDVNGKTGLEREPEGGYNGQVMLYTGNDTYRVDVQSDILGVLFSANGNGGIQTFDYNEFWKLQQLGYDNITFEIKEGSSETVAKAISDAFKDKGNTVYSTPGDVSGIVNDTDLSNEFFLDTNIEGYVIDVFGNKLLDINGDAIKYDSLKEGADEQAKLSDLLKKMGKTDAKINALYGARYGDGKIYGTEGSEGYGANAFYGMDYPIRVYYFNNLKQLISQQISGYGPIEGAASLEAGKTNRDVYAFSWKYFEGTNASSVEKIFSSEFNVIDKSYEQVPYLVSYKLPLKTNNIRVAGKWYYQRDIAQFGVNVQTAILEEGTISVSDKGGSATVNGQANVTVNQGDIATFNATVNNGYAFVGWYNSIGEAVSAECYGTTTTLEHVATGNETVYAVFRKLQSGTLKVTNQLYRGSDKNPTPGGGSGNITATLYVKKSGSDTYVPYTNGEAQIQDGDMYYWVLTAKATGADKFIAFRQLETNTSSEYFEKYVELNTLDGNLTNDGNTESPTYTFTSYKTMWYWKDMTGSETATSYTIERYTDFQKVDVYATLNYHYQDRFGKDKLYVVRVRLSNDEIADHYKPSDATIKKNAPYINDLFKDCTWNVTDSKRVSKTESRAEITADQSEAKFDTFVQSVNGTTSKLDLPYDTLIQLTTDKVSGDKTFSYWMQYDLDSDGKVVDNSGVIFSYNRDVSVRVTFNRKFVAVYGQSKELFTTNLQDAVYTREQSTNADGTVKYDYVYSDFLTQFETSIAGKTFADVAKNGDTTSGVKNVRFGIITEYDYNQTAYTGGDLTSYKSQAKKDTVTSTIITLDGKKKDSLASGWSNSTATGDAEYNYYYNLYDLSGSVNDLTDLGRKDFFFKFENTTKNQGKVYNVYTYVIYEDASDTHVVLSAPRIMNIYATGTTNTNTPVVG